MPKELFGTDGIRGLPGEYPLDNHTLYWVGRALGAHLQRDARSPRVLIGMDTRESGPHLAGKIAAGLDEDGVTISSAGVITTPGVACLARQGGFACGVVISASHNPYHDNGVKLFAGTGMKFPDRVEESIEREILKHKGRAAGARPPKLDPDPSLHAGYLDFLRGRAIPGAHLAGLKLALDCANGAASRLGPELFRSLGAQVIAIHSRPNGRNINAGCGSLHPQDLREKVLEERADFGVAFDGDADRAIFVGKSGKLVNGDGVLLAAARYLKSVGQLRSPRLIGTTMANLGLERTLAAEGLSLARVRVGDRYVLEEMLRSGANLGGEQSGHIIFLDDATTGDGLLTALKVACLVALQGPLEELVRGLKVFPQTILNVKVRARPPFDSLPEVASALEAANRSLGDSGRVVLRYSGTEPLARVMVEAERDADVHRWAETLASAIRSSIGAA